MNHVLRIPWAFGSINRALYTNWRQRHKAKKSDEADLRLLIDTDGFSPGKPPFYITFLHLRPNRRSDPDNFCAWGQKVVLDAVLGKRKDGMGQIHELRHHWDVDADNPSTLVCFSRDATLAHPEIRGLWK